MIVRTWTPFTHQSLGVARVVLLGSDSNQRSPAYEAGGDDRILPPSSGVPGRPAVVRRPRSCNARAVVGMVRAQDRRGRGELAYSLGGISQTPSKRHTSAQNGASMSSATCGCVARRDRNHSANTKNTTAALAHLSCGRDLRWVARSRAHCNQSAVRYLPAWTTVSGTTGSVSESLAEAK